MSFKHLKIIYNKLENKNKNLIKFSSGPEKQELKLLTTTLISQNNFESNKIR